MEYLLLYCFIEISYTIQDYFALFIFTMYKMLRYTDVFSIFFIRFFFYT